MVRRGELYRVAKPSKADPKDFRVFVIVVRQEVIDSSYSTIICAPVYSNCLRIETARPTGDMDIWIRFDQHNAVRTAEALEEFGYATRGQSLPFLLQLGKILRMGFLRLGSKFQPRLMALILMIVTRTVLC